jgi:PAS domain S-box-containing protein
MTGSMSDVDWDSSPLGPRPQWPAAFRTLADLIMASPQPMFMAWGDERILFYNKAYAPILGARRPHAFGRPFFEVWPEVRAEVGALFDRIFDGSPVQVGELGLLLDRGDGPKQAYFSFSYTPVIGDRGEVEGLFCVCNETTGEVVARNQTESRRQRQRTILQQMPSFAAILSGPEHVMTYVNDAFVTLTGQRVFLDRPVRDVFPDVESQGFFEILDQVYASGQRYSARAARVVFDNEAGARSIDLDFQPIRDEDGRTTGVFVGGYDVTDAEARAKALREKDELLAAVVASSDDAIISKTVDGLVTSWNAGAERMFGYTASEMVGGPISRLAVAGREDEMPAILERVRRGERVEHFETERRHKDGSSVFVSLTVSPIHDEAGRVIGASKVAKDITGARRSAEALQLAQERLQDQHRELLHAARLGELGQMAATLAHEINQPLSAIINYLHAGAALMNQDDPGARPMLEEAVQLATDQAVRAAEVVRRLRSFAKPNDGASSPERINEVLRETAALAGIDVGRRGVKVIVEPDPRDDLVDLDRIGIQQVLMNLIRNALEAMDGRAAPELTLSTRSTPESVEVSVADTGPGLDPSVRERLFQPFVTTKGAGMGIGLSICRKIIEAHGGRLWAENRTGGGAIFRFALPKGVQSATVATPAGLSQDAP